MVPSHPEWLPIYLMHSVEILNCMTYAFVGGQPVINSNPRFGRVNLQESILYARLYGYEMHGVVSVYWTSQSSAGRY